MRPSFGTNLPQSVTHIWQKAFFKHALENGWYQVKQKGSHHQYRHPTKPGKVTIPEHGGDLNPDTVKSIIKQAGL